MNELWIYLAHDANILFYMNTQYIGKWGNHTKDVSWIPEAEGGETSPQNRIPKVQPFFLMKMNL